jgi:hypothetical protein
MPGNVSCMQLCDQEMRLSTDDVLNFNAGGMTKQDAYIIHFTDKNSDLIRKATLSHYTSH